MAYETEDKVKTTKGGIARLQKFVESDNIADLLDDDLLTKLGNKVVEDFDEDEGSRADWLKENEKAIKCAKQIPEEKSFPWPGASNVKYPLVTSAAIHFNSRALPAIISNGKVAKGRVIGEDLTGEKEERAGRIGEHMSYQLTEEMDGWEEETDQLLTILPITGNVFRKTYYCPIEKKNVSKIVRVENFCYNYESTFETAHRHTEIIPNLYLQDIVERQRYGIWSDVDLEIDENEEDEPQEFLEQHKLCDLDDDGYKEPYIITVHKETRKIVRIVARYDVDNIEVKYKGEISTVKDFRARQRREMLERVAVETQYQIEAEQAAAQGFIPPPLTGLPDPFEFDIKKAEIVRIKPVKYYTKYSFIPAFDGGGYDVGLGALLGSLGEAINTNLNQMIDAGTQANLQGGLISKGLKVRKGQLSVAINEWKTVENTAGMSIRDNVVPFEFKGPSPVLFNLLGLLIEAAKEISSVKDSITGEAAGANESPTVYLSRVAEGLKVFSAIYIRIHRSLKQELRKLYRLNRLYLPEEKYYSVLDTPKAIKKSDYEDDTMDVVPVSDPTIATATQRISKTQAMYQAGKGNPYYNQYELEKRFLESIEVDDMEGLLIENPPEPPPDPRIIEAQAKTEKMSAETGKIQAETAETYNDIQAKIFEIRQEMEKQAAEIGKQNIELYKFFKKLDFDRFSKQIDLLSKIVPDQENLRTYEQARGIVDE